MNTFTVIIPAVRSERRLRILTLMQERQPRRSVLLWKSLLIGSAVEEHTLQPKDEIATKLSAVRATQFRSRKLTRPLITVCSACHNVIKQTNYDISHDEDIACEG